MNKKSLLSRLRSISILPNNRRFFTLFQAQMDEIKLSSSLLLQLTQNSTDSYRRPQIHRQIKESETRGDNILGQLYNLTNDSVTSPFPRQDILNLGRLLDDVLDGIEGAADHYINFEITEPKPALEDMARIIAQAGELLTDIIPALQKFDHPIDIYSSMRELEHRADDINKEIIPRSYLAANAATSMDEFKAAWINAIATDKIITKMETTADSMRHVADTIKEVIAKRV